jgi:hypothetical protein
MRLERTLRDGNNRRIGEVWCASDGLRILRDASGKRIGYYDPEQNVTRDQNLKLVADGDLLVGMLSWNRQN